MSISEISVHDLAHHPAPVVVDVREVDEYLAGHVPGAVNIPLSTLVGRENEFSVEGIVYVICQVGGRSMRACDHLSQIDELSNVEFVNVAGGTGAWILEGHKVVTGDQPN
jgi:rhodanese-related sulfurtransferase